MFVAHRLLLTGATGNVGGAALRELQRQPLAGTQLAVAAHNPEQARQQLSLTGTGVAVVPFDFTKPETVALALQGVTGLLLIRPPAISNVRRYLQPVVQATGQACSTLYSCRCRGHSTIRLFHITEWKAT